MASEGANLGRTQVLVLRLLASGAKSAHDLNRHWPGLTESAARGAVERLASRGLVDSGAGNWSRGRFVRTYKLTAKGREVEANLNRDEEPRTDE